MWAALRAATLRISKASLAAGEKPANADTAEAHTFAMWSGQPQIMGFWQMLLLQQGWEIAKTRKLAAQHAYNDHKANHAVLHPSDDDYVASLSLLNTLRATVDRAEFVLQHQMDRYMTVKQIYKNACRSDVFEANTHSSFFMRMNDAGSSKFHDTVKQKYGEIAYSTIKELVARIKAGEVAEEDMPPSTTATSSIVGGNSSALVVSSSSGSGKKGRAGSTA